MVLARALIFITCAAAVLAACKAPAPAPVPPAASKESLLLENARIVLEKHCGKCHIGLYDTALPGALAIFDLDDSGWNTRLTAAQLLSAKSRIDARETLEGEPSEVTDEERALIAEFVAQELRTREGADAR